MKIAKLLCCAITLAALALPAAAVELDPKALAFQIPADIKWSPVSPLGNQQAVLFGNPNGPGLYGVLNRWTKGDHFSRPHFHPNDRFIYVISGTWWVATGNKFDLSETVPMKAGAFVTHYGKQVHWDGAKDEDAVILIVGEGPATNTPVEMAK